MMFIIGILLWYLIGSIGGIVMTRICSGYVTIADLIILLGFGGIVGPLTILIIIGTCSKNKWLDKKIF